MTPKTIAWRGLREHSRDIPDFVDQLLAAVMQYPAAQRAEVLSATLREIEPGLERRIAREIDILSQRGYGTLSGVRAAIVVSLMARRTLLFRTLLMQVIPKAVREAADAVLQIDTGLAPPPDRLAAIVDHLINHMGSGPSDLEAARTRLRETGFSEAFVQDALLVGTPDRNVVLADIIGEVNQAGGWSGQAAREVLEAKLRRLMNTYFVMALKSWPVAQGPDFCFAAATAAIVAAVCAGVGLAVTAGTAIAKAVYNKRAKERIERAQREAENILNRADAEAEIIGRIEPLSAEEITRVVAGCVENGQYDWQTVETALRDAIRVRRFGREVIDTAEYQLARVEWSKVVMAKATPALARRIAQEVQAEFEKRKSAASKQRTQFYAACGVGVLAVIGASL